MRIRCLLTLLPTLLVGCGNSSESSTPAPRSVVLITIDTLRADRLGCYGYERAVTPNIDALAGRGVLFERAFSTVPITMPSHTSLLTGTIPPYHGVRNNGGYKASTGLVTMAEVLGERGYNTGAFIAAHVLDSQYGLDQGFDVYGDVPQTQIGMGLWMSERPAENVNAEGFAWLDTLPEDEPFFLWLHYFDPHRPRTVHPDRPASLQGVDYPDWEYDMEVWHADRQVGEVLKKIEAMGRTDETLIVLGSDHGEGLGEHGEHTHAYYAYQGVLHVPLIFAHPSLPQGLGVRRFVSNVDVLPTVLELVGAPAIDTPPPSESLTPLFEDPELSGNPVYFECYNSYINYGWAPIRGVGLAKYKLISVPKGELFDLDRDPAENRNLHAQLPDAAEQLERHLAALLADNVRPEELGPNSKELSDEERARLLALGYMGGDNTSEPEVGADLKDPKDGHEQVKRQEQASIFFQEGKLDEAAVLMTQLIENDPGNGTFQSQLGSLLMNMRRFEEAIPYLEKGMDLGFRTVDNYCILGQCLMVAGRSDEAVASFKNGLVIDPKHLRSHLMLGDVFKTLGRKEEALHHFRTFLDMWHGDEQEAQNVRNRIAELEG